MENIEFTAELVAEIVKKFNDEGIKKSELAAMYGTSEKTLQRRIRDFGYQYNTRTNKYIKVDTGAEEQPKKVVVKIEKKKAAGRPSAKTEGVEYVKRTYNIPKELDKKLKIRAIEEDLTTTELLQMLLEKYLR